LKAALKRGVETGVLVQVKASYKLSAEAKKPLPKKKAVPKKATAVKKIALKKKVRWMLCCMIRSCSSIRRLAHPVLLHTSLYHDFLECQATVTKKTVMKVRTMHAIALLLIPRRIDSI
jgi:hypothetical protein